MFLMVFLVFSAVDGFGGQGGDRQAAMDEYDCCPAKKIWGSLTPSLDGVYDLVQALDMSSLPKRCNTPCVYKKRGGPNIGGNREARKMGDVAEKRFCFADSIVSQSECTFDGEEPVFIGDEMGGSGSQSGMGGSGFQSGMGGSGFGSNAGGNREARILDE